MVIIRSETIAAKHASQSRVVTDLVTAAENEKNYRSKNRCKDLVVDVE